MWETISLVTASRFLGAGLAIGFGAIGAALGEGYAAGLANEALSYRPVKSGDVLKNMLVGQAIAESAAIFALVIAILLIFGGGEPEHAILAWPAIGSGLAMGLSAIGSGIGAGLPAGAVCVGIVRQPATANKTLTTMLIGSAVCQTPAIFGMVIAFLLLFLDFSQLPLYPGWATLLGAGLATGIAAIGPGVGNGLTAMEGVTGVARNPGTYNDTNRTMLVGLGIAQSTAIYGFLVSLMLLFQSVEADSALVASMAPLGAACAAGFGGIGPGMGIGYVGASAVRWVARRPTATATLTRTMLVGMAVTESTAIYALIVALLLLIVV